MIELAADREFIRPWIICETTGRWLNAVRRFGPEMMPRPWIPAIRPAEPSKVWELLPGQGPALVLWEVGDSPAAACDYLARTRIASAKVLQLVAGSGLSNHEIIMLSQFGAAIVIRHPEDLPRLKRMIHGHFATTAKNLVHRQT